MSRLLDLRDHQANKMTDGSFDDHQSSMEVDAPRDETPGYDGPSACAAEETGPEAEEAPPPTTDGSDRRRPCHVCSRSFYPGVLSNHVRICRKITSKTRTVFDSRAMRAVGTPMADFMPSVPLAPPPPEGPRKPSDWRRNHERLIANIRAKKDHSQAPPSHAFNYSDNNNNNNRGYGGGRYSGNVYGDVHLQSHQANGARTPQEAIQLAHNT